MKRLLKSILPGLFLLGAVMSAPVAASTIPYPDPGTEVGYNYQFYAATTGPLKLYLAPSSAGYENELFIVLGGGSPVDTGLNSHGTVGNTFSIKTIAGQSISFLITSPEGPFSSLTGNNADGFRHLYFTRYTTDTFGFGLPADSLNSYFAFEDLRSGGDKDYNDLTFVTTRISAAVPEPSTWALMLAGFIGLGMMARRRSRSALA